MGGAEGHVCTNLWERSARVIKTGLSLLVMHGGDKRCRGRDATDLCRRITGAEQDEHQITAG